MQRFANLYQSSIGKKTVMAVTGFLLVVFVIGHMVGNLKLFQGMNHGVYKIDAYGEFLRNFGYPALGHEQFLWMFRIVMLLAVCLHAWSAVAVWRMSRIARPDGYRKTASVAATYASRTMRLGGIWLALFVVYHILHLTTGQAHPDFEHGAVFANMIAGFSIWWVSAIYIVSMVFLGMHLYHGIWSAFQTLGVANPQYKGWRRGLAILIALVVSVGNISMPVAVLAGIVKL